MAVVDGEVEGREAVVTAEVAVGAAPTKPVSPIAVAMTSTGGVAVQEALSRDGAAFLGGRGEELELMLVGPPLGEVPVAVGQILGHHTTQGTRKFRVDLRSRTRGIRCRSRDHLLCSILRCE